jgi:hypothetical protein
MRPKLIDRSGRRRSSARAHTWLCPPST